MSRLTITIICALSTILAACGAPPETDEGAVTTPEPIVAPGPCDGGQTTCWKYSGQDIVYGTCSAGTCCFGCVDSRGSCQTGNAIDACGKSGSACYHCDDANECTVDSCSFGTCHHTFSDLGTSCNRGTGRCNVQNGTCCGGVLQDFVDPSTFVTTRVCETTCAGCTCENPTTHLCESAGFDCSCL